MGPQALLSVAQGDFHLQQGCPTLKWFNHVFTPGQVRDMKPWYIVNFWLYLRNPSLVASGNWAAENKLVHHCEHFPIDFIFRLCVGWFQPSPSTTSLNLGCWQNQPTSGSISLADFNQNWTFNWDQFTSTHSWLIKGGESTPSMDSWWQLYSWECLANISHQVRRRWDGGIGGGCSQRPGVSHHRQDLG